MVYIGARFVVQIVPWAEVDANYLAASLKWAKLIVDTKTNSAQQNFPTLAVPGKTNIKSNSSTKT